MDWVVKNGLCREMLKQSSEYQDTTQSIPGFLSFPPWWILFLKNYFKMQIRTKAMHFLKRLFSFLLPLFTQRIKKQMRGEGRYFSLFSSCWLTQPCCNMARATDDMVSKFPRLVGWLANSWVSVGELCGRWALTLSKLGGFLDVYNLSVVYEYAFWGHSCKPELWTCKPELEEKQWGGVTNSFVCV